MPNELRHDKIKHVIVLMLENRGFDHLMGWLYDQNEQPTIFPSSSNEPFLGLSTLSPDQRKALANPYPPAYAEHNRPAEPIKGARSPKTPSFNPGENFPHIMNQMWGVYMDKEVWFDRDKRLRLIDELSKGGQLPPPMNGYILDYDMDVREKEPLGPGKLNEIMETYIPQQVPVLSGLARFYAVSDQWFCSVPSQTNTNRAFSMGGTSRGLVNNSFYDPLIVSPHFGITLLKGKEGHSHSDALPVSTRSLFEILEQFNVTWMDYWQDTWPPADFALGWEYQYVRTMFPLLDHPFFDKNFAKFNASDPNNALYTALRDGTLPAVSWIEPKWGGGPVWEQDYNKRLFRAVGNDYHPVEDTTVGEDFVMNLYNALTQSPLWSKTLLIITFDENGGTYDHFPPPKAKPSGNDRVPLPASPDIDKTMDQKTRTQFGFEFDQFGVRVPTLLISPWIGKNTIFRSPSDTPFDHTSIISTILTLAGIDRDDWLLGNRVADAPTFDSLLLDEVRHDEYWGAALSVPPVPQTPPPSLALNYDIEYLFEYVGDIAPLGEAHSYFGLPIGVYANRIGSLLSSLPKMLSYPSLTKDKAKATGFKLVRRDASLQDAPATIQNMSLLRIVAGEEASASIQSTSQLTVSQNIQCVYFDKLYSGKTQTGDGGLWQIRIFSSRDPQQHVQVGDYVYFVSQFNQAPESAPIKTNIRTENKGYIADAKVALERAGKRAQAVVEAAKQRVAPDPLQRLLPYPSDEQYLTTRAGEWALWKIIAVGEGVTKARGTKRSLNSDPSDSNKRRHLEI